MSSMTLWFGCLALLLMGTSLMLWAEAARRCEREASHSFTRAQTEQINARHQPNVGSVPVSVPDSLNRAWQDALRCADIEPSRRFYVLLIGPAPMIALVVWAMSGAFSVLTALALYVVIVMFLIWNRTRGINERLLAQLPGFLDGVVWLTSIGSAMPAAFQAASTNTEQPPRNCLTAITQMQRAGKDLDTAVLTVGQQYRVNELVLLSSVLRFTLHYGGRTDIVMERTAAFMRDRQQIQRELFALLAETRLSAWIIGLLPVVAGGVIIMFNAVYVMSMWRDPSGKALVLTAFGMEVLGAVMLARLAKSA